MDIDPQSAADSYRARVLDPLRATMPAADIDASPSNSPASAPSRSPPSTSSAGSSPPPRSPAVYDHIIFDTAPTGHTLRLLELPAAWSNFIEANPDGASCLGPLSALGAKRSLYQDTVAALGDPTRTTVVLVARPERAALAEADRAGNELAALGVTNQRLIVNGILADPLAGDRRRRGVRPATTRNAFEPLPARLATLPVDTVAARPYDLTGIASLRALSGHGPAPTSSPSSARSAVSLPGIDELIAELAEAGPGVTMVMGKGGVGKTTVATTSLTGSPLRDAPPIWPAPIPPDVSTNLGQQPDHQLDRPRRRDPALHRRQARHARPPRPGARDLLAEDLRSPCTEELAVFVAFSTCSDEGGREHVVIDTAPTGHTLLLLDQTGSYHHDVMRTSAGVEGASPRRSCASRTRRYTRILIVTLAQTTPVQEATELQDGPPPRRHRTFGWIINASLAASDTTDPVLLRRATLEHDHIRQVHDELARRAWIIPWKPDGSPHGSPITSTEGLDQITGP